MKLIKTGMLLAGLSVACVLAGVIALAVIAIQTGEIKWGQASLALILLIGSGSLFLRFRSRHQS